MKIQFLGTCAYDYVPELGTTFKNCLDKNARRSASALIEGHILIDCGDHTVEVLNILNIDYKDIDILLLTHLHIDHYQPECIRKIAEAAERELTIYVNKDGAFQLSQDLKGANVIIHSVDFLQKIKVCNGIHITGLPANHTEYPVHYLLEKEDKRIFYAIDGAWIMYDTFYALRDIKLDLLVLDGTMGDYEGDRRIAEHNSIPMIRLMLESFRKFNMCKSARVFITHIAPSLHKTHNETVELLRNDGIEVAYDGLELEI